MKAAKERELKAADDAQGAVNAVETANKAIVKMREEALKLSKEREALQKKTSAQVPPRRPYRTLPCPTRPYPTLA